MDLNETRERIIYQKDGAIAKITLNWPEKANAQDQKLAEEVDAALLDALRTGDATALATSLLNDLQAPALHVRPALGDVLRLGEEAGALSGIVSGSGPTCVFLCASRPAADAVREAFIEAGHTRVQASPGPVAGAHEVSF